MSESRRERKKFIHSELCIYGIKVFLQCCQISQTHIHLRDIHEIYIFFVQIRSGCLKKSGTDFFEKNKIKKISRVKKCFVRSGKFIIFSYLAAKQRTSQVEGVNEKMYKISHDDFETC